MCRKNKSRIFMLSGCVTYLLTLIGLVCSVIYIVDGIIKGIGAWPIIGAFLSMLALIIVGGGLGLLFQSTAFFLKKFSTCKPQDNINK